MRVPRIFVSTLSNGYDLVIKNPLLWLYFFIFVVLDILVVNFVPEGVNRILILLLNLLIIGLPGLKVEFLDSLSKNKQPEYKRTLPLLFKYFKKLFWVNLFLIFLGSVFFAISVFVSTLFVGDGSLAILGYPVSELIRLVVYLPLAVIYFSLFHLFVVILVKKQKGVAETFKLSVEFVKKNTGVVIWIVLLSLIVHYPVSELLMIVSRYFVDLIDPIIIRGVVSFINIIIDLFFFAVWMVLYNKKS